MKISLFLALTLSVVLVDAISLKERVEQLSELRAISEGEGEGEGEGECPNCGGNKAQICADGEGDSEADSEKEGKGEGFSEGLDDGVCAPSTDKLRRDAREALARLHAREQEHCAQCAGRLTCCSTGGACPCGAGSAFTGSACGASCGNVCGARPACGTGCGTGCGAPVGCARPACAPMTAVQPLTTRA